MAKIFSKGKKRSFLLALVIAGLGNVAAVFGDPLQIITDNRDLLVEVEIVDTPEKRGIGLMYRTELAPLSGMLFDFNKEQPVSMWMKNTLIELDMFFTDRNGHIVFIKENAKPGDLSIIGTDIPVRAVLEMKGGFAKKHGIKEGDTLNHTLFDQ